MAHQINQVNMTFADYPGGVIADVPSIYRFPEIRYFNRQGRVMSWQIIVQLCAGNAVQAETINSSDDPSRVTPIAIRAEYFDRNPGSVYARVIVIRKQVKVSVGAATLVTSGKNLGHINETSILRQGLIVAFGKYADYVLTNHNFAVDSPHLLDQKCGELMRIRSAQSGYVPPMLPSVDDPQNWWSAHGGSSVMLQLKLNGTRCIAGRFSENSLKIYTRGARPYPMNNFWNEVDLLTAAYPLLIFDGEAYRHDLSLQEISGSMRNQGKGGKVQLNLDFYIYDCFNPADMNETYSVRYQRYMEIGQTALAKTFQFIKFLPVVTFDEFEQVREYFTHVTDVDKYEGLVMKDPRGIYEPSYNNYRSAYSCKYKGVVSTEFKLIGWRVGEGKAAGMIASFECEITEISIANLHGQKLVNPLAIGARFFCNIKATEAVKSEWYQSRDTFDRENLGRYVTVEFRDVSKTGIPMQSYWIDFTEVIVEPEQKKEVADDFD